MALFNYKSLQEEKTVIKELGESQPLLSAFKYNILVALLKYQKMAFYHFFPLFLGILVAILT
jgi:hypothetical protein